MSLMIFISGFNRGDDNITNTLEAVMAAKSRLHELLWGIELGNEPDCVCSRLF